MPTPLRRLMAGCAGAEVSLFDLMELEGELSEAFGRPVDIVEPDAPTNPIRRQAILTAKQLLYAA